MAQPCQPGLLFHALRTRHKQVLQCKASTQAPESTRHMPQHSLSSPHLETPWAHPMTTLQSVQELLGVISAGLGTDVDLKSLLGRLGMGLAAAAVRQSHNVRPVVRLYDRLLEEAGPLVRPRVKMSTDPYRALHQTKALILQGRNKEGKTTLLCTALPWYHRRGPWAYYGLYFNGGHGNAVSNFEKWHTVQLFGNLNMGGSET